MSDLKKLQRVFNRARNAKEKHLAAEDIAEYFLSRKEFNQALEYYEITMAAATELKDEGKIAKAHRMIGEVQVELSEYDDAIEHTRKYYDFACSDPSAIVEQQRALTTLGRTYLIQAEGMRERDRDSIKCEKTYKRACDCLWKSLKLCEKLLGSVPASEIHDMRARCLLNLGLTYEGMGKFDDAAHQFGLAIRLCRKFKLDTVWWSSCLSCASLFIRQEKFEDALELYREALSSIKALPENSRARIAADILYAEAEGHLWKGDIHTARRALQRAYRFSKTSHDAEGNCRIIKKLKLVAAMDICRKKLSESETPPDELSKLSEELGDGFSSYKIFSYALEYYEKMLEYAKIAGNNLKPCYVSLAETCKDLKKYSKAISYFEQEMLLCETPTDACDTLLNIHECLNLQEAPLSEQLDVLERAYSMAERADCKKLQKKVLQELHGVQLRANKNEDAKDSKRKLDSLSNVFLDDEGGSEETPTLGDYIDLDALSDSSDDDEESTGIFESTFPSSDAPKPKRKSTHRRSDERRNEKGETKLHIACQKGNVKAVKTLLAQGYDVNAVDNAGWTPLHEACNHGFQDIVELLLQSGANINHKGGPGTGGVTPLHDAAQAGNFDVIEFLLDRNASVRVFTDMGQNVLDALEAFYDRSKLKSSLSAEDEHHYRCVRDRLKACLVKAGVPITDAKKNKPSNYQVLRSEKVISPDSSKQPLPFCQSGKLRRLVDVDDDDDFLELNFSSHRKRSMRVISPVSSGGGQSNIASDDDQMDDEGHQGVAQYIDAIQSLRKNAESPCSADTSTEIRKPLEPLLDENEIVEDWLDDDIGKQPNKKRRKSDHYRSTGKGSYKPLSLSKRSSTNSCFSSRPSSVCSTDAREDSRCSIGSRNSETFETSFRNFDVEEEIPVTADETTGAFEDPWSNNINLSDSWPAVSLPAPSNARQVSLLAYGVTRQQPISGEIPVPSQTQHHMLPPSCVNVQVEDHRLAIFVQNPSNSIGWLAEEAARRYKKVEGSLPTLLIYSADGALYSEEDPVQMVLGTDVIGRVQAWNNSTINERYEEACQVLSAAVDYSIMSHLEECLVTHSLDIVDSIYPTHVFKPVFRAISQEHSLSRINLSNNLLQDKGVKDLCDNLGKLSNLRELDLSGNNITALAVAELGKAAKKGFLKALQSLNLSHNNLEDASLPPLIDVTASAPNLQNLYLADCMFTKAVGDKTDQNLSLNQLLTLDLSFNRLHAKGLARFLGLWDHKEGRRLSPERLRKLILIGIEGEHLCQELILFLEQADSIALRELHLSYSSMKDEEFSLLLRVLQSAPELNTINLPCAQYVKFDTVCRLILQPSLRQLEIHNSQEMWINCDERNIVSAISKGAQSALERLTMREVPESARNAWCDIKGTSAVIRKGAFGLQTFSCGP